MSPATPITWPLPGEYPIRGEDGDRVPYVDKRQGDMFCCRCGKPQPRGTVGLIAHADIYVPMPSGNEMRTSACITFCWACEPVPYGRSTNAVAADGATAGGQ